MTEGGIILKSGEGELRLDELSINAEIVSGVATATVDMVFYNVYNSQLEGELDFPLPEDAVVCGYAYEFEGHMVPASIVEKEEARVTFEKEARSGAAVSLVEHVKGNNFKVRVYPLPPKATKRVSLTFMLDLPSREGASIFQLPFRIVNLPKLHVAVQINESKTVPVPYSEFEELKFEEKNKLYTCTIDKQSCSLSPSSFKITIPLKQEDGLSTYIGEKDLAMTGNPDEVFFLVHDYPSIKSSEETSSKLSKLGVVWDASLSMNSVDRSRELALLREIAQSADTIDLIVFRNTQEPSVSFAGTQVEKLIQHLSDVIYDGGSDIANLSFAEGCDKIILFTDGLSTLSGDIPAKLPTKTPVFAVVNSTKASIKTLKFVANKTGGQFFNLLELDSDQRVVTAITKAAAFRFLYAEYDTTAISEVFPDSSFAVEEGEKISFVGKLQKDVSTIKFHYGTNPSRPSVTRVVNLTRSESVGASDTIPRVWAQLKADSLALLPDQHKAEIIAIGRKYGIVTPGTSLLVLTSFEQYLKYGIEPNPEALPAVYDAHLKELKSEKTNKEAKRKEKLDKAAQWWQTRVEWWQRDYSTQAKETYKRMVTKPEVKPSKPSRNVCDDEDEQCEEAEICIEDKKMKECDAPVFAKEKKKLSYPKMAKKPSQSYSASAPAPAPMLSLSQACPAPIVAAAPLGGPPPLAACAPPPPPPGEAAPPPPPPSGPGASSTPTPASSTASAGITIKEWSPDRVYLTAIKATTDINEQYKLYVQQRNQHGTSPAFFLDVASHFSNSAPHLSIRIITSILELKLEDPRLLRIVAYYVFLKNSNSQAKWLFQQVVKMRGEEPQSYRDLAMVHLSSKEYQQALDLLWKVVESEWPVRFQHIEDEVLMHLNRTIFEAQGGNNNNSQNLDISKIDNRFIQHLPVNIHCTIAWDTDDTCIDLHITEPDGTKCMYSNHITQIGGFSTPDYPGCTAYSTSMLREYMIRNAMPGEYKLACNYYSNYRQDLTAGTTMWFTVTTNFGTAEQVSNTTTLRLECNSTSPSSTSFYEIGSVSYGINAMYQAWRDEWKDILSK